ncbi:MAG: gamma-glutamylcyclotransferase [Thermostichales cyanobacterium DRC_bins_46]
MRRVFICGSALSGQPNHDNLQGAKLLGPAQTTPHYRMHSAQNDWHPAIYRVETGGIPIPGEVYEMSEEQFTYLKEHEPPYMYPAEVTLADGSTAVMFMYPQEKVVEYNWPDISEYGGWANYMATKASQP